MLSTEVAEFEIRKIVKVLYKKEREIIIGGMTNVRTDRQYETEIRSMKNKH